jgi:hypothetical protein
MTDDLKFVKSSMKASGKSDKSPQFVSENGNNSGILAEATKLTTFIDPAGLLNPSTGPRQPLVILSFDEGHMLADTLEGRQWSLFSELRRALRLLVDLPIFSLFLSTAAKFRLFSPDIQSDPSRRVVDLKLPLLNPISEISFDDLAPLAIKGTVTLNDVIGDKWISHLGRPLYEGFALSPES